MAVNKVMGIVVVFLGLTARVYSVCKDLNELPGSCSACGDLDIMFGKDCFPKIRGCLNYAFPDPSCAQCQSGYVLYKKSCMRQAVFKNLNITDIPPVVIDKPATLTYDEIKLRVGDAYSSYFTDANEQFLSSRPELGKGNIKQVKRLDTKKGQYFIISYESTANPNKYQAVSLLNPSNKTSPLYFQAAQAQPQDPLTADTKIRSLLGSKLTNFFIYELRFNGSHYTFFYMNSTFYVYQVQAALADLATLTSTNLGVKNMTAADLAMEQLLIKYPEMKARTLLNTKRLEDFYAFTFDGDISASVRFTPSFNFEVNKPIKTSLRLPGYDVYDYFNGFFDMFGLFSMFNPAYYACLDLAGTEVPQVKSATPVYSSSLTVPLPNGQYDTYFNISLSKNWFMDNYIVYALYTAQGVPQLQLIKKDPNILLYSAKYNYNADPLFFKAYNAACTASKVLLIPSIVSVLMKVSAVNVNYYKVTYPGTEFMEFRYNKTSGATSLVSYTVDNQNILGILGAVGITPQKKQPQLYLQYLQTKKFIDPFTNIASFIFNPISTILNFVNSLGTYKANISNTFSTTISQVSKTNCFDFGQVNRPSSDSLDAFLRANYQLSGYTRQLVQSKVNKIGNLYRVLYSNGKLRQVQFIVEQLYTLFNVVRSRVWNQGFQLVDGNGSGDYQKIMGYLGSGAFTLGGSKVPLLTESNVKEIRSFYNDGHDTYKIAMSRDTGKFSQEVYAGKMYPVLPTGFTPETLIIPGTPSAVDETNLQAIKAAATLDHPELADATLIFAAKSNSDYKLMFKSPADGYIGLSGVSDGAGNFQVANYEVTSYDDSSFTLCAAMDGSGKCTSCTTTQLEYQGSCWPKLEGCKTQAGGICLRCSNPYILSSNVCKKQCTELIP